MYHSSLPPSGKSPCIPYSFGPDSRIATPDSLPPHNSSGRGFKFFLWHKMPYLTVEEKMSKDIFAEKIAEKLPPKAFAFYF